MRVPSARILGAPRGSLTFRIGPNSLSWSYHMKTSITNTYGGRVVQLLAVNVDGLTVQFEAGKGGVPYLRYIFLWMRDLALWQRQTKELVTFSYPFRNVEAKVVFTNMTLTDSLQNVTFPYTINFAVQNMDKGPVHANIMKKELERLRDGIGYTDSPYTDPTFSKQPAGITWSPNSDANQFDPNDPLTR